MPAFSAYGKMFENAARKDVQGNVDKLRSRAKALQRKRRGAMVLRKGSSIPQRRKRRIRRRERRSGSTRSSVKSPCPSSSSWTAEQYDKM